MKKIREDKIPVSKISHTTVNADFSGLNGEGKILFLNPKCVLGALNEVPYILFVTANFDHKDLVKSVGEDIYEVKQLVLQPTFSYVPVDKRIYCKIPDWLPAFKNIELLKFEYVELDELWLLKDFPVQNLILKNVKFNDLFLFIDSIVQFDLLNEITYDHSLNDEVISGITSAKPGVKLTYQTI